jgi:tRNA-dihydrouridine synthase 1
VKAAVSVPVFANGNILYQADIAACLAATGADAVMSAEGQLYNPALFAGIDAHPPDSPAYDSDAQILVRHPRHADLALEYLEIVKSLKTTTSVSGIKGHLFKIMRPGLVREQDLREKLGRVKISPKRMEECIQAYVDVCNEMKERMEVCSDSHANLSLCLLFSSVLAQRAEKEAAGTPLKDLITTEPITGIKMMPHWLAQPYFRPSAEQKKAYGEHSTRFLHHPLTFTFTRCLHVIPYLALAHAPADTAAEPAAQAKRALSELPEGAEQTKRARLAPEADSLVSIPSTTPAVTA